MKNRLPLVSVVILLYRKFDNVYRALDSVFCQTYKNIELVVSDDGSPNFPQKEIKQYILRCKTNNIVKYSILANKENAGTVRHANIAFSKASGELFKLLAGDDQLYDENVISKIVDRYIVKPFNVLSTSSISFYDDGSFYRFYPHIETGRYIENTLQNEKSQYSAFLKWKYHDIASGSTMVLNADFFHKIGGFDESYILWEDGPFFYKITKAGYKIDTAYDIISVRYSQGGVSTNGNPLLKKDLDFYNKYIEETLKTESFRQRRYVKFLTKTNETNNKIVRSFYNLLYLDVYLDYRFYYFCENRRAQRDIYYYKELIK